MECLSAITGIPSRGSRVNQSGGVSLKTVVLVTPEDMDKAAKKTVQYRPPGH